MAFLYGIVVVLVCLNAAQGQIGLGPELSHQHSQSSVPAGDHGGTFAKKNSSGASGQARQLQPHVSLDKTDGVGSLGQKSASGASQAELLQNVVVLGRNKDGRSVKLNSSIASQLGCLLYPVPNEPQWFQVDIPNYGSRRFPCPTNTLFDAKQCGCGWVDNPNNPPGNVGPGVGIPGGELIPTSEPVSTTKPPCKFRTTGDRHFFEQFIVGHNWLLRRCPMGTLYNEELCGCYDIDPNQKFECHPELWLNFNDAKMEDASGYGIAVGNNGNVRNVSNAGRFDGTGTLTVWQYSNQDLGTELTINLRFYEFKGGQSEEQVLIANCYGRRLGSVEIAINQVTKEVIFRGDATLSEPAEIRLPYKEKSWKNVTFTYNGQELTGQVDQEIKSAPLKGHLATRFHGFNIGSCNGRAYVGYIDDLRLYRCLLDGSGNNFGGFGGMGAVQSMFNSRGFGL